MYSGSAEYVLSAATTLFGKSLSMGGNVKYVTSFSGSDQLGGDSISNSGGTVSFDLGGLFKPSKYISLGVVGYDINAPSYQVNNSDTGEFVSNVQVNPSLAIGLALKPSSTTTLAADFDRSQDSNEIHLGLEQTALWDSIALRLGMMADPSDIGDSKVITGGAGLKIYGFYADMAIIGFNIEHPVVEFSGGFRW